MLYTESTAQIVFRFMSENEKTHRDEVQRTSRHTVSSSLDIHKPAAVSEHLLATGHEWSGKI